MRQLPSITPPPGFREAVFAAIRADEQRMGRAVASLTEADTSPELPIVSVAKRPVSLAAARQRRAAWLNPRIAVVGAAAAIMLGLLATQLLPHANLASFAASLGFARAAENTPLTVAHYMPDTHARSITRALATSGWLVYSAADSAGATTIYAESRQTKSSVPLARGSATAPVALHAVTNDWALWSAGTGSSWTLYAGRINGGANATALLHSGTAATDPSALNGVWANEHVILVAFTTHAGASRVLQLASPAAVPMLLAQTTTPGHTLTDPSADGALVYWVESWRDVSGQHSLLWSRNAAHQTQQLSLSASAFAPHIVRGTLLWVDGQHGTLEARSLTSSQQRWVLAQAVDSASVRVAGETVLWRAGGVLHTWDARTHTSSAVDAQLRTAAWAEASDTSILWAGPGGSINVYDVH